MNKFTRFYNQNRIFIISVIVIFALILIVVHTLNDIIAKQQEENKEAANNMDITNTAAQNREANNERNESALTGKTVQNANTKNDLIKTFVDYCNAGKDAEAYSMLTDDCKTQLYPTLEYFRTNYIDRIFDIYRIYKLENWYTNVTGDTYQITYTEDILATGNTTTANNLSEYITLVNTNMTGCLNVSDFVKGIDINRQGSASGVTVTVGKKYLYMDYTIFDIEVKNGTSSTICLDPKTSTSDTYIYDEQLVKYNGALSETSNTELVISPGATVKLSLKFNKRYSPDSRILKGMKFNNIILNYNEYANGYAARTASIDIDIYV